MIDHIISSLFDIYFTHQLIINNLKHNTYKTKQQRKKLQLNLW